MKSYKFTVEDTDGVTKEISGTVGQLSDLDKMFAFVFDAYKDGVALWDVNADSHLVFWLESVLAAIHRDVPMSKIRRLVASISEDTYAELTFLTKPEALSVAELKRLTGSDA